MEARHRPFGWGFFSAWVFAAAVGAVVAYAVFFVTMSGLIAAFGSNPVTSYVIGALMTTLCFGSYLALTQWAVLRQYLADAAHWIWIILVAYLVASPVQIAMSGGFGLGLNAYDLLVMNLCLGLALGIGGWLFLRGRMPGSGLWIAISLLAWMEADGIALGGRLLSWFYGPILYWPFLFFFGTIFSGLGLIFLLSRPEPAPASQSDRPLWRRALALPATRMGWWAFGLAIAYVSIRVLFPLGITLLDLPRIWIVAGAVPIGISVWGSGTAAAVALTRRGEGSVLTWIALLPAVLAVYTALLQLSMPWR